ncbi:MAG TPA: glycosyl transferase family 2 [Bacteroidales bacterium]|nr:glycosyl transferase family 2 [Bacteroidales bacterium]
MIEFFNILRFIAENAIIVFTFLIFGSYTILTVFSAMEMVHYMRKNSFVDYDVLLTSPLAPSISIIAPAYNEGKTIVDNIRSLLSLHYNNFEVIIVNDGSTDDTIQKVIDAYDLVKVPFVYLERIQTKPVKAVYQSRNKAFKNLKIIDKVNGGKSDAMNVGISFTDCQFVAIVDVDCVLVDNALQLMVKPFLEEQSYNRVIASGGVIRVANSCHIEDGRIIDIRLPRKYLPKMQVIEYTRAFLMGRMAWSRLDGLLLISGAFGMFDREILLKSGGYSLNIVGEDMELVVKMRRYMAERNQPYKVTYIPNPLCWTEVPEKRKILIRQRDRWTRGNIESIFMHFKIFFNPKYKSFGMLGHPYWFFFEWLAPIIEFLGLLYFTIIVILGFHNWYFFFLLLAFVYFFAINLSYFAILFEELSYHQYKKRRDMLKLMLIALIEPVLYHPMVLYSSLKGNYKYLTGEKSWGKMERKGFVAEAGKKKTK